MTTKQSSTLEEVTQSIEQNINKIIPFYRPFKKKEYIQRVEAVVDSFSDRPDIAMSVANSLEHLADSIRGDIGKRKRTYKNYDKLLDLFESEDFRDVVEKHAPEIADEITGSIAHCAWAEHRYDAAKVLMDFYGSDKFKGIVDAISKKDLKEEISGWTGKPINVAKEITDWAGQAIAPLQEKPKDFSWVEGFLDLLHENKEEPYVVRAIAYGFKDHDNKHYILDQYQKPEFKELMAAYASKSRTALSIAMVWPRTSEDGKDNGLKDAHELFLEYSSASDETTEKIMNRFSHWNPEKARERFVDVLKKHKANPEHVGRICNAYPGNYTTGDAEDIFIHLSDKFDDLVYVNFGDYISYTEYDTMPGNPAKMAGLLEREADFISNETSDTVFPLIITMLGLGENYYDKIKQAAQEKDFTMHLAQAWENILELPWKGSCCLVTHSRDIAAMKTEKGKEFTLEDIPMKPVTPREIHKMMGTEYADEEMRPFYGRSWTYHVHEDQMNAFYENLKQKLDQGTAHDWLKEELLKTDSKS